MLRASIMIAVMMVAGLAAAQTDTSLDAEARALYEAGRAAFDAGRYEDALGHFRGAYERSRRAELLYNVGLTADRLRLDETALESYEKFLDSVPNTSPRTHRRADPPTPWSVGNRRARSG